MLFYASLRISHHQKGSNKQDSANITSPIYLALLPYVNLNTYPPPFSFLFRQKPTEITPPHFKQPYSRSRFQQTFLQNSPFTKISGTKNLRSSKHWRSAWAIKVHKASLHTNHHYRKLKYSPCVPTSAQHPKLPHTILTLTIRKHFYFRNQPLDTKYLSYYQMDTKYLPWPTWAKLSQLNIAFLLKIACT